MSSLGASGNGTSPDEFEGSEPIDSFAERAEYLTEEAEDAARRGLESARSGLSALYDGLADESSRAFELVEEQIEEHPWLGILVGFGLGCLLGATLLRRD
jgi:ElaB/YqjD/DUF883 family membrane-anchored ribosome-binding protein